MKLEYYVYIHNINGEEIKKFNVFDHAKFLETVKKALKTCDTKELLAEEVRSGLMWCYWSKCEWETVITSWPPRILTSELDRLNKEREETLKKYDREPYRLYVNPDVGKKIDVYEQVKMNWDLFIDYIWSHKRNEKNKSDK